MPRRHISPEHFKKIARERIQVLFTQAGQAFKEDSKLSDRYVLLARKIAMKYKVSLPSKYKRRFCKNCHRYLVPSVNCRVRLHKKRVIIYCMGCRHYMRIPYKK